MDVPTSEPASFVSGDTVKFSRSWSDTPRTDGWTLTYTFRQGNIQATATTADNGEGWTVTLSAADSALFSAGPVAYQGRCTLSGETYTMSSGQMECTETLADNPDIRTHARRCLDLLEAAIEARITGGAISQVSVSGYSLSQATLQELHEMRARYRDIVRAEQAKASGRSPDRTRVVEFTEP